MNKKSHKKLTRQKRIWEYSVAQRRKAEREISKMEHEVQKIQNSTPQAIKTTSEKELARVEASKQPKQQHHIEDIREYRKKRAKRKK